MRLVRAASILGDMTEATDTALAPIGSVRRTQVGREATEPMREDIRLLGAILGDTVREQNGEEVFDLVERARVESFRVRRSEIDRAELAGMFDGIDIHQAIPVIRAFTHFALLANVAEDIHRERRRAVHVAAGEPPQDSSLAATYLKLDSADLDSATVADALDRRAGVAGDHRAPHRDPAPHRVRHPAPHHRADAAAPARPHPDRRRPRHRTRAAPPHPDVVADRADPVVAVEDSGRDRNRAAVLPGGVLRSHPAGQRRGAHRAAGPLARRAGAGPADPAARVVDRRRPRRQPQRHRRRGSARHRQRRLHRAGALLRRNHRAGAGTVDVGAAGQGQRRAGRAWPTSVTSRPAPTNRTAAHCG